MHWPHSESDPTDPQTHPLPSPLAPPLLQGYPTQPEDEWSAEQYRALLATFRQAVEPQVVATAAHNMALALGVPASHYQQQELAQALGGSPRQQAGGGGAGGGGDAAVLRVVVEGAMRVWLRVKGTNPEYAMRVSGCRKHGGGWSGCHTVNDDVPFNAHTYGTFLKAPLAAWGGVEWRVRTAVASQMHAAGDSLHTAACTLQSCLA